MASIKQASNERLRRIERDCHGLAQDPNEPAFTPNQTLSIIEHEKQQRGEEIEY